MLKRSIELAPLAQDDWRGIWDYSVQTWSAVTAKAYFDLIADRLENLAMGAVIGLTVLGEPGMLKSIVGSHVIYFELMPSSIYVVRILHQSMDVEAHI